MKNLSNILKKIKGKVIKEVICGGSNGSIIVITTENSISLTIDSVWRLTNDNTVLVSWDEKDNSTKSNFVKELSKLENDTIESFELSSFYDITLKFISGKTLFTLCDINKYYNEEYYDNNWVICDESLNYCICITKELQEKFEVFDPSIV